jgi:hypothetical protein
VLLQLVGWARCRQPFTVKTKFVTKMKQSFGPGRILWTKDPSDGICNVRSLYREGGLLNDSFEGTAGEYTFSYGKENENHESGAV